MYSVFINTYLQFYKLWFPSWLVIYNRAFNKSLVIHVVITHLCIKMYTAGHNLFHSVPLYTCRHWLVSRMMSFARARFLPCQRKCSSLQILGVAKQVLNMKPLLVSHGHPCGIFRKDPTRVSQESPGTSLKIGVTWCPEDPTRDIPGQS